MYHISETKKAIRRNEQLREWMKDKVPDADYSFRYSIKGTSSDMLHGGLFSFKRGTHTNRFLIADDVLRDPANPLNLSQLIKAEDHFMTETIHIPVGKAMVVVLGTPMAPKDLLEKLADDERFRYRFLPALDPVPGRRVLCPEIRTEQELLTLKRTHPRSFASEMMLQPYTSTDSYITDEEISLCEDPDLKSLDPQVPHAFKGDYVVAGFDVGKKRHPSHIAVYVSRAGQLRQVHQAFLDGMPYVQQVKYLNDLAENFGMDRGYIDNTRGELEERGLNQAWKLRTFTPKYRHLIASTFEEFIVNKRISLIVNERQKAQIVCVNSNLEAQETPLGHGDAFWSNALASLAAKEVEVPTVTEVGSLQELTGLEAIRSTSRSNLSFPSKGTDVSFEVCPECEQSIGWIPARKLCLICHFNKSDKIGS